MKYFLFARDRPQEFRYRYVCKICGDEQKGAVVLEDNRNEKKNL